MSQVHCKIHALLDLNGYFAKFAEDLGGLRTSRARDRCGGSELAELLNES